MKRILEKIKGGETRETLTPEQELELYAEFLLSDKEGNPRVASAEHIMPLGSENGRSRSAQAKFYRKDGGYIIDEYRDGGSDVVFQSFVLPNPNYDPEIPGSHKWDTGMLRMYWMRFSIHEKDNIEPILSVLRAFFGDIPEDRQ